MSPVTTRTFYRLIFPGTNSLEAEDSRHRRRGTKFYFSLFARSHYLKGRHFFFPNHHHPPTLPTGWPSPAAAYYCQLASTTPSILVVLGVYLSLYMSSRCPALPCAPSHTFNHQVLH